MPLPENKQAGPAEELLLGAARAVRANAYCPYSNFAVGAAVRLRDGRILSGCNVENASYGLTICAERNAVFAAVAAGMQPGQLAAVAIAGGRLHATGTDDRQASITPCGACRQVLHEFAAPDCIVICAGADGAPQHFRLSDLLPAPFET
jgi:homotetrameric cytidine deaminase